MKNLCIYSRDHVAYLELANHYPELIFNALAPSKQTKSKPAGAVNLIYAGQNPSAQTLLKTNIMLGEPDLIAQEISAYPDIEWVQSTWAGNNKLQELAYSDYTLTGCKGIFGQQMLEYVLAYLLYFERNILRYQQLKQDKVWAQLPSAGLQNKTLGIMGLGSIAQDIVDPLQVMGLNIIGLVRRPKALTKVKQFTMESLSDFAQQCDYVLNLLPETPQTKGICNAEFFKHLPSHCLFINVGRGSIIDTPQTIVNALNKKHLRAAVVDVFEQEPLPPGHPFYDCENLSITCHTAAVSTPSKVFEVFIANLKRFIKDEPLLYVHDFSQGY